MIDPNELHKILEKASIEDLSRIIWHAGQYNTILGKVGFLHAAFLTFQDEDSLKQAILEAATIDDFVPYTEASSYGQIVDEIVIVLKRLYDSGHQAMARRLAVATIECAERSAEQIQEGDWEMSLDDLRELAAGWEQS